MKSPSVSISYQGRDVMGVWAPHLVSVTVTDESGENSDNITIKLDDQEGQIEFPGFGQVIRFSGGYEGSGGRVEGEYEIDRVDLEGMPMALTIHGTSVSASKATKENRTEAHKAPEVKTLGDLAGKIAKRNGWTPKIGADIARLPITYEGQAGETDMAFLHRLAGRFGSIVTVKQGRMIMTKPGGQQTASGRAMTPLAVALGQNLISYRASFKNRQHHDKAEAHYFDRGEVKRIDVDAGQGDITFRLREPFKSRDEAKRAAESKLDKLRRGEGSLTLEIEGDPGAIAEQPVEVSGIRSKVDGAWVAKRVEHRWDEDGYTTTLECEPPNSKSQDGGDED